MYAKFSVFQSHIDLAHHYWESLLRPGELVIDATCGNGHDTLYLAQLIETDKRGSLYAIDLQNNALVSTRKKVEDKRFELTKGITFIQGSHETFPISIEQESVSLIVYNLGYLPGDSKEIKTQVKTTLASLQNALGLIKKGGAISITCYSGHDEGAEEEEGLLEWASTLPPTEWSACFHRWLNRRSSPSLLFLQKKM